jgi:hypothetical protein
MFNPREKVKEYQQNFFEHILRMLTNQIPWNLFDYHHKGRRHTVSAPKEMEGSICQI